MNITYKSRVFLVRLGKIFPFMLCAIVCFCYVESIFALLTQSYYELDGSVILYKPFSWTIGRIYMYEWETIIIATILSLSMETCIYNKLSIVFLCINALERNYFIGIELYEEHIYMIVIANIIASGFLVYKGMAIQKENFFLKKY